jgi:16S rRNA processing protein RimM
LTAFSELVAIGRIVKPQGRKGEVLTHSLSDRPDRFPSLKRAYVEGPSGSAREIRITACWPHKGRFVLKIEGVDSIDAAEGYRGQELRVGEEELAPLPEGTYYHHELLGLAVRDPEGRVLGRVAELLETGGEAKVLVVRGEAGEHLFPLAAPFVRSVDLASGVLVLVPQETVDAAD